MLPRLPQHAVLQEPNKHSFRHSKSYTVYRTKTPQNITVARAGLPLPRRTRLGSYEITLSRRLAIGTPQRLNNFGKSSRGMRSHCSEEMLAASKQRVSHSCNLRRRPQLRKMPTQYKPWNADTHCNQPPTVRLLSAQKRRTRQPPVIDSYKLIMDQDYRKYQLQPAKRHELYQFDLDKMFKRSYRSLQNFTNAVCFSYGICFEKRKKRQYQATVDKGNNSQLVKHLLSSRFWWALADEKQQDSTVQFHWSQKRKMYSIGAIPKANEYPKLEAVSTEAIRKQPKHPMRPSIPLLQYYRLILNDLDVQAVADCSISKQVKWKELRTLRRIESRSKPIEFTHNHLEFGQELGSKKQLFHNIKTYLESLGKDPFSVIPLTFHITGIYDPRFAEFTTVYLGNLASQAYAHTTNRFQSTNIWIVKPGYNTNRGTGIEVLSSLQYISEHITATNHKLPERTFIVQEYLNPFLFFKRKFDIRCYLLVTSHNGHLKGYFYRDGYLRTSSKYYSLKKLGNKMIHLTNDAVQKKGEEYGRFEKGNKISYSEFQKYLDLIHPHRQCNFEEHILPEIKEYARIALYATSKKLDANRRGYTFELFGLDFLLDESLKPWLIEVNCNPCLELSSPLLSVLIPSMLENTLRIAIDSVFPPPEAAEWPNCYKTSCPNGYLETNRYELIFESERHDSAINPQDHRYRISRDELSCSSSSLRREA